VKKLTPPVGLDTHFNLSRLQTFRRSDDQLECQCTFRELWFRLLPAASRTKPLPNPSFVGCNALGTRLRSHLLNT
jgi:hypothetical protein